MGLRKEGLTDVTICDHVFCGHHSECSDFDDYTTTVSLRIDENAAHCGRPVIILAHSGGAMPALDVAKKLGRRCLKLYVVSQRPPSLPMLDDVYGIDSGSRVSELSDSDLARCNFKAWPSQLLREVMKTTEVTTMAFDDFRRMVGPRGYPFGSKDLHRIGAREEPISAPIMALAAEVNADKGETPEKMMGWRDFTRMPNAFKLEVVEGVDQMSILSVLSPAVSKIILDVKKVLGSKLWLKREARWTSCLRSTVASRADSVDEATGGASSGTETAPYVATMG